MSFQKLAALRAEADAALARAEKAEGLIKRYEQTMLGKDQEIASLQRKLSELEQREDTVTKEARATKEQLVIRACLSNSSLSLILLQAE